MKKNNIVTQRLTDDELGWLGALCRRSRQSKSETIRSLIMNSTVRERITKEHLTVIRQLIGESPISPSWQDRRIPTDSLP